MNKQRIEELKALATEVENNHGVFGEFEYEQHRRLNVDKLIELVLQECADLVDRAISDGGVDGSVIKQHFGVE